MINSFTNEYKFLSNFYPCQVAFEEMVYPSAEHAYQAAKSDDLRVRRLIAGMSTAREAKKFGGKCIPLPANWLEMRIPCMREIVGCKFRQNPDLETKLLATEDEELIEGNYWGDMFWGTCNGEGENNLGKILMWVRAELKEGSKHG